MKHAKFPQIYVPIDTEKQISQYFLDIEMEPNFISMCIHYAAI